jgi:hypothetical protein
MHRLAYSKNDAAFMVGVGRETMLFLVKSGLVSAFEYGQNGISPVLRMSGRERQGD